MLVVFGKLLVLRSFQEFYRWIFLCVGLRCIVFCAEYLIDGQYGNFIIFYFKIAQCWTYPMSMKCEQVSSHYLYWNNNFILILFLGTVEQPTSFIRCNYGVTSLHYIRKIRRSASENWIQKLRMVKMPWDAVQSMF